MDSISLLIQTDDKLISVNQNCAIMGEIKSTSLIIGYDKEKVLLTLDNLSTLFNCESRNHKLNYLDVHAEPANECLKMLSSKNLKLFPIFSFKFSNANYLEMIKMYPIIEQNERNLLIWKCAYSYFLEFINHLNLNQIKWDDSFLKKYIQQFEIEIEQDVLYKPSKKLNKRLDKIFTKIALK